MTTTNENSQMTKKEVIQGVGLKIKNLERGYLIRKRVILLIIILGAVSAIVYGFLHQDLVIVFLSFSFLMLFSLIGIIGYIELFLSFRLREMAMTVDILYMDKINFYREGGSYYGGNPYLLISEVANDLYRSKNLDMEFHSCLMHKIEKQESKY